MTSVGVAMTVCWVTWYCYSFLPWFKCIFQLYSSGFSTHNMNIGTIWHCASVSCDLPRSIGLILGCVLFRCWMSLCVPFINSLIKFYSVVIVVTIIGIFTAIIFILNYTFRLSESEVILVLQMHTSLDVFAPVHSLWILDWTCYRRPTLCNVKIL